MAWRRPRPSGEERSAQKRLERFISPLPGFCEETGGARLDPELAPGATPLVPSVVARGFGGEDTAATGVRGLAPPASRVPSLTGLEVEGQGWNQTARLLRLAPVGGGATFLEFLLEFGEIFLGLGGGGALGAEFGILGADSLVELALRR